MRALADAVPDAGMRAFLLQNLQLGAAPAWRIGLSEIIAGFADIEAWDAPADARYAGPTLFIAGATSNYIKPEHRPVIRALFPRARFVTLKNAGHWLHADNPAGFVAVVEAFLTAPADASIISPIGRKRSRAAMRLTDEESAMLAGEAGPARQWAIEHQMRVGRYLGAADFVPVSQAHIMADTESLGVAGVEWLERLAALPEQQRRVRIPTITDPRGTDFAAAARLKQQDWMLALERRAIAAFEALGVLMTDTCINYQTIMPAVRGEHMAYGDTGVVIYSNSVLGARSNFEGGPSALAAGLTGRTPRYGYHLPETAPRHAAAAHRPSRRASCTTGVRWAASSAGSPATTGRCRRWSASTAFPRRMS